jgi:hypothetical protein
MWYGRNIIKVHWTDIESYWKFPIILKLKPTPTKDTTTLTTSQAKSNPSERHIESCYKILKR